MMQNFLSRGWGGYPSYQGYSYEMMGGGLTIGILFMLIIGIIWLWALIDCAKRQFNNSYEKLIWVLAMFITPPLAVLAYFLVIRVSNNPAGILPKK